MFKYSRLSKEIHKDGLSKKDSSNATTDKVDAKQPHENMRRIGGTRTPWSCLISLPNADSSTDSYMQVNGLIILNIRGCSLYLHPGLTSDETKRIFPESRLTKVTELILIGEDSKELLIKSLPVRRVRILKDENGIGIVLRFVNLNEIQLDTLCIACNHDKGS